jgi:hypothetical protein
MKSGTLTVPGAVLHYDVQSADASTRPVLLLIASPMGADGFITLAGHFTDRTVVTYDPRSSGRSQRTDGALVTVPEEHADDLHRLIRELDAMAKFIAIASYRGPVPASYADQPDPDPAAFGLPAADDGSRNDPLVGQNMPSCVAYQHDFDALGAASTRIVLGVGEESAEMVAGRAAVAVAGRLGLEPVTFPGGHDGFAGGEYGRVGSPGGFAATLRTVLDSAS